MIDAAELALAFVQGRNRANLEGDPMRVLAPTRAMEIVGEAAAPGERSRAKRIGRRALAADLWYALRLVT